MTIGLYLDSGTPVAVDMIRIGAVIAEHFHHVQKALLGGDAERGGTYNSINIDIKMYRGVASMTVILIS